MKANSSQWPDVQIAALIDIGVNPIDAQRSVSWVWNNVPVGADLAMWIPNAAAVSGPLDKTALADVRAVWYERKAAKYARLLDARRID